MTTQNSQRLGKATLKQAEDRESRALHPVRPEKPHGICASVFDALPDNAFIREAQLVQSPKRPNAPAPLPFSAPTLWRLVAAKKFPAPLKLSQRVTAWKVSAVRQWIEEQTAAAQGGKS